MRLKNGHLMLEADIVNQLQRDLSHIAWFYNKGKQTLLLAAPDNENFKQLYKSNNSILKYINAQNDRSFSIQEIIIDHQIDATMRNLTYDWNPILGIFTVQL